MRVIPLLVAALAACTSDPIDPVPADRGTTWGGVVAVGGCIGDATIWTTEGAYGGTWTCRGGSTSPEEHSTGIGIFEESAEGLTFSLTLTFESPTGSVRYARGYDTLRLRTSDSTVLLDFDEAEDVTLYLLD